MEINILLQLVSISPACLLVSKQSEDTFLFPPFTNSLLVNNTVYTTGSIRITNEIVIRTVFVVAVVLANS